MDATRWIELKDLFRQAFDLPREERTAFLDARCADAELRARVESLLHAEDESARGLQTSHAPAPHGRRAAGEPPAGEQSGTAIGAYKLLQRIGEGGFGTVYMAEQQHPVRRRVALKIIKLGMDTAEIVARFEQERQALAMMDHPHIARVYDGGATATGRPYFVMELVRGVPIVEYCDTHHLSIRERLELFTRVCDAVQHAHQKGVIHRDLKPSNILVASLDGRPQPKVIDFGIAKAVRERLTDRSFFTNFQQMIGTPQYMSPEQADGSLDIDTRSDVYSLGVVLYELLTGATPVDVRCLRSLPDIQRAIREIEPPKPSTRLVDWHARQKSPAAGDGSGSSVGNIALADRGSSAADIARQRRVDLPALVRQLRGEPDWIVMKALEKDRVRRYESVGAFAADVQRFLRDEPVQAGPPSKLYRLRKFARRNRAAFVATAAVVVALLLGLIGTLVGLFQAVRARESEHSQKELAEKSELTARAEAARAGEMAAFLKQALLSIDPMVAQGRDTSVLRDVLVDTSRRLETELANQPRTRAELYLLIGQVYWRIGQPATAEPALRKCLSLIESDYASAPAPFRAKVFQELANALEPQGDLNGAIAALTSAEALEPEIAASDAIETLRTLSLLKRRQGRFDEARALAEKTLRRAEALDPANPNTIALCQIDLACAQSDLLKHADAEELLREALAYQVTQLGPDHLTVSITLEFLGCELYEQGKLDEAIVTQKRVLEIQQRLLGDDHMRSANSKASLAISQMAKGDFSEARELLEAAVATTRKAQGGKGFALANDLMMLAVVYERISDLPRAKDLVAEAIAAIEQLVSDDHPLMLNALDRFARILCGLEEYEAASAVAARAIRGAEKGNPGFSADEAIGLRQLAAGIPGDWSQWELQHGNIDRALELARRARVAYEEIVQTLEATLPAGHWKIAEGRAQVGVDCLFEADIVGRNDDQRAAATDLLVRAESLCREAAERFARDDSELPDISRQYFATRAVERMTSLYEVWSRIDPSAGKDEQLAAWRETLQRLKARYEAASSQP